METPIIVITFVKYILHIVYVTIVKIYVTKIKSAAINVRAHSLPTEYYIKSVSLFGHSMVQSGIKKENHIESSHTK